MAQQTGTPAAIARTTGQSRARAYEVLRELVKKGLAYEEPTRPVRFRAVPLSDVLSRTMAELSSHHKILQDLHDDLPAEHKAVAGASTVVALSPDLVQELRQARKRDVDVRLHFLRSATLPGSPDALEDAVHAAAIRWVDPRKAFSFHVLSDRWDDRTRLRREGTRPAGAFGGFFPMMLVSPAEGPRWATPAARTERRVGRRGRVARARRGRPSGRGVS